MTLSWTDERVTLLKQLWGEGKSAAEIAKALGGGVTRNAVIGKAHRLKLSNRVSPIQQNTPEAPRPARKTGSVAAVALASVVKGKGVKMADLKERMCRWPVGDPRDAGFHFCGCQSIPSLPYCLEHARIAYQTAARSRPVHVEAATESDEEAETEFRTAVNG